MEMTKMNHKSGLTYIVKGYYNKMLGISKLHISDDDCNEFTVVVFADFRNRRGWHDAELLNNCICKPYDDGEWTYMKFENGYNTTSEI